MRALYVCADEIAEAIAGASVRANLALLTNNARVPAQLASALVQSG